MLAVHDGRALLGRQHRFPPNRYSALAGFVEVGESVEEAVARELKEEAGINVHNVRYVASHPWPSPSSLMIGCFADAENDLLNLDAEELDEAFWASRAEVLDALVSSEVHTSDLQSLMRISFPFFFLFIFFFFFFFF